MNNWKVIFATVVIFGAGVITGGVLVDYVQHCPSKTVCKEPVKKPAVQPAAAATNVAVLPAVESERPPRLPEVLSKQFLLKLDEGVHLTVAQREAAQKIIAESQNLMRKTLQDARLEIRELLTTEQRKQFDELMKKPFHKPIAFSTNVPAASAPVTNLPVGK